MKLYSGPMSMFGAKAEIAIAEKGLAAETIMVPFSLRKRYDPKHPVVARVNPKAQVPVLVDGDVEIFDSTLIFEYLEDKFPEPSLWPRNIAARAEARQLELKSDEVFFPNVVRLMGLQQALESGEARQAQAAIAAYWAEMDARLAGRSYLAGDYSFADIAFFMGQFFAAFLREEMPAELANGRAWRERMIARPAVRHVLAPMCRVLTDKHIAVPPFAQALVVA